MSGWFSNPRCKEGQAKSIAADEADRRGETDKAMALHLEAARAFASVAIVVPADYPNTRSDIAISAVVSFACADRYDLAVRFARRMLAQGGMLSPRGRGELAEMVEEYAPLVPKQAAVATDADTVSATAPIASRPHLRTKRAVAPEHRMRGTVRVPLPRGLAA